MTVSDYFRKHSNSAFFAEHELWHGEIRRVLPASAAQLKLFANLSINLGKALRSSDYQIQTDQVRLVKDDSHCVLACGACINQGIPRYHREDLHHSAFLEASMIFDFPKGESELQDFQENWTVYNKLPNLRGYALLYQTSPLIEVYLRNSDETPWEYFRLNEVHHEMELPWLGTKLDLLEIYDFD